MAKIKMRYPWFSTLAGLALIAYLYLASSETLIAFYHVPELYLSGTHKLAALLLFCFVLLAEAYYFHRRQEKNAALLLKYREQLNELLKTKNNLQIKVQKYSDNADKLKLFISDRLLEYIEYDEKFIHFKNVASEVRHNGVVCYDKVNSVLRDVMVDVSDEKRSRCDDALNSMIYLWDLLDLSTTDNISLYIANKLYEAEEQYYQILLNPDGVESPFVPMFFARRAVYKAVQAFVNGPEKELPPLEEREPHYFFSDERYWMSLEDVGSLLGNENYIVLLVENIVNNALYYAESKKYGNKYARVAIALNRSGDDITLSVYNHGPLIDEDARGKLFKLGYSTKKSKGNNGKGLGLYFVNEIVKGYEGRVEVENVLNVEDVYVLRIELANGERISEIVDTALDYDGRLKCKTAKSPQLEKEVSFEFPATVVGAEVSVQSSQKTYVMQEAGKDKPALLTDPHNPASPQWVLEVRKQKGGAKAVFQPLDRRGVRFAIHIPTAESRLDSDYHEVSTSELDNLDELSDSFADIEPYVK